MVEEWTISGILQHDSSYGKVCSKRKRNLHKFCWVIVLLFVFTRQGSVSTVLKVQVVLGIWVSAIEGLTS